MKVEVSILFYSLSKKSSVTPIVVQEAGLHAVRKENLGTKQNF